jgi:shikimate dehydrogenase
MAAARATGLGTVTGRQPLSGHTRVVGVIGDPVAHSLSPTLHNAAFESLGLDWVYVAFPVPRGRGADAVAAVSVLGLAGLSVTMPHKEDVAGACDELTPDAAALRSVNTVVAGPDGRTLGDSTDGPGFLDALADDGIDVAGRPVLVLGAGGAARAVILALGRAGAAVTVAARRPEAGQAAAALAPGATAVPLGALPASASAAPAAGTSSVHPVDPAAFAVIVNATPLGMSGGDPLPVDPEALHAGQAVVDLVYHPADTPLLTAARSKGALAVNGLGMLLHQAARSFTLWTGQPAPIEAMRSAGTTALAER